MFTRPGCVALENALETRPIAGSISVKGIVVLGPFVTFTVPREDFPVLAASEIDCHALYGIPIRFS